MMLTAISLPPISMQPLHSDSSAFKGGTSSVVRSLKKVVSKVALGIILNVAFSGVLFYLQPNLFCVGFAVGFVFDREVAKIAAKVKAVFQARRSILERILLATSGAALIFLTLPTTLTIANLYHSARWGARLTQKS
jgi:hypothetical protein